MWYIIQVKEGQEETVCNKCRKAFPKNDFRKAFVPQYLMMKRYQGEWHTEQRVLFPGYFIVDTEQGDAIRELLDDSLSQIAKPVCVGSDFVPIYPEEEEILRALLDGSDVVGISKGNIVNGEFDIQKGPLSRRHFCIRKVDRHKRLADIELVLHGKQKKVQVALEIVNKS